MRLKERLQYWLILLISLYCACADLASAQVASRPADQWIPMLEAPDRVENLKIPQVIAALHLRKRDAVADIGAGSGVFSRPLAREIDPGILYAVDIDPELLNHINATCKEQKITNVRTVLAATNDPKLPEKVDLIFLCDTVHHIANPDRYVSKLPSYLKRGGRIAVIDFREHWPAGHESMSFTPEQLQGWMNAAGMKKVEDLKIPTNAFFHIYERE
ncbi:MAG TPA: class I SAM-dependent methyltransferase [Acidobacteriota bacterium]|jgi:ubiquinone/menaquinone biosynthesis C-methylase UbiE